MFWKENENRGETSKLNSASMEEHTSVILINKKFCFKFIDFRERGSGGRGRERKTETQREETSTC